MEQELVGVVDFCVCGLLFLRVMLELLVVVVLWNWVGSFGLEVVEEDFVFWCDEVVVEGVFVGIQVCLVVCYFYVVVELILLSDEFWMIEGIFVFLVVLGDSWSV